MTRKLDEKALAAASDVLFGRYDAHTNYDCWIDPYRPKSEERLAAAISAYLAAYLSAAPSPAPVSVKALRFQDYSSHAIADSAVGRYTIRFDGSEYCVRVGDERGQTPFACGSLEEVKAAAQADFEARIRSALVETADSKPANLSAYEDAASICDQIGAAYIEKGRPTGSHDYSMMAQAAEECARMIRALHAPTDGGER